MNFIEETLKKWLEPVKGNLPPLFLVGGCVRDYLLCREPKDIDMVCRDAEKTAKKIAAANDAAFVPFGKKVDEPCFRIASRSNPDSFLDISPIYGDSLSSDLMRRDFTINAMAVKVEQGGVLGEVIDTVNGKEDLDRKVIRMTNAGVFSDDPLRMLRGVRFAATLGFDIEETTLSAMKTHREMIRMSAAERCLSELTEILRSKKSASFVRLLDDLRLLEILIPEIIPMKGCAQNGFHHLDVWEHSLGTMENCEELLNKPEKNFPGRLGERITENLAEGNRLPVLKLGALLHDVGKPDCKAVHADTGKITFYGHHKRSGIISDEVAMRLRMSRKDRLFLQTIVIEHMQSLFLFRPKVKKNTVLRWMVKLGEDLVPVIIHGMADCLSTLGPDSTKKQRDNFMDFSVSLIKEYYESVKPRLQKANLVTGKDLMDMGVSPGPDMGRLITKIREAQNAGVFHEKDEALEYARKLCSENRVLF